MQYSAVVSESMELALKQRRKHEAESPSHADRVAQGSKHRCGHEYGNAKIGGHAQAQFGDTIHNYYSMEKQQDNYESLLQSLRFERMDARLRNIATAPSTACEWLFTHPHFAAWIDNISHHGLLWIKGKPGSGKSTIMKKALAWAKRTWPTQILMSYFFNARAPGQLEKSVLGLYRSLLYQLLSVHPEVRGTFLANFSLKEKDGKLEEWTTIEIQNFLIELVTTSQLPPVSIFIDALDEGDDHDVRHMISFFERLLQDSTSSGTLLRICLSSRHYPYITVRKGVSIIIEDQTGQIRDIEDYIQNELQGDFGPQMEALRREVCDRSARVFLWIVLVVPMLNQVYIQGKSLTEMRRKLKGVPSDLHQLFAQVLSRDAEGIDECILLLRWVLFSFRPLSSIELYTALQQAHKSSDEDDTNFIEQDNMDRYLLSCSRGLVEMTKSQTPAVQFIHETVRDYLTDTKIPPQWPLSVHGSYSAQPDFRAELCHRVIAEHCLHYLLRVCRQGTLTEGNFKHFPLAEYTAKYWWQHARMTSEPLDQRILDLSLSLLTENRTHLLTWVHLYDIDQFNMKARLPIKQDEDLGSPLYYAASAGLNDLVRHLLYSDVDIHAQGGLYGNALQAASDSGHETVVRMLLEKGIDANIPGGYWGNALQAATARGHETVVRILLGGEAHVHAPGGKYRSTLEAALKGRNEKLAQILLEEGTDIGSHRDEYGFELQVASFHGSEKIVQMLLDLGADVNAPAGKYGNALYVASISGYEEIVKMLLDAGADLYALEGKNDYALHAASASGYEGIVQMLLDAGADPSVEARCIDENGHGDYGHALYTASIRNNLTVMQVLLQWGVDPNAHGEGWGTALYGASALNLPEVVQMLLDAGADPDVEVQFTVENCEDEYSYSLWVASWQGFTRVVQILLEHGADVNVHDSNWGTALQAASAGGHKKVVMLLLDAGATVSAEGSFTNAEGEEDYGCALYAASAGGHVSVVRVLLGQGADANAHGRKWGTALIAASSRGHKKVMRLLLDAGADIDAVGTSKMTKD